jgi:predicted Fe-S protein YdhL (DUF1289 family)
MKYRFGFKCKGCGYSQKELFNCDLTFKEKKVSIMLCNRCMKKFGLRERPKEDFVR